MLLGQRATRLSYLESYYFSFLILQLFSMKKTLRLQICTEGIFLTINFNKLEQYMYEYRYKYERG